MNPDIFVWLFLYRTKTTNLWVWIAHRVNLRIWYQDDKGWPDLLVEHVVDDGGGNGDNLWDAVNHRLFPRCQCNRSQPRWYSQLHTLAHVAADHEAVCNLPIPNGTAENTKTFSSKLQIELKWRYGRYSWSNQRGTYNFRWMLAAVQRNKYWFNLNMV